MTVRSAARRTLRAAAAGLALAVVPAATADAQAWFYPSFQVPRIAYRDYNFGVAANNGTSAIFQWREGITSNSQLSLDAGLADQQGEGDTKIFVGGQYARELVRASVTQPLDMLLTAGAGFSIGDGPDVFRIPVGVSVGHRFALEGDLAITPYVHPRASLNFFSGPGDSDDSDLSLDFDIGGDFELTRQLALRASLLFSGVSGADNPAFGISVNWTPTPIARR